MTPSPLPGAAGPAPKPSKSIGQLSRVVLAYARAQGLTEKRTRDWISYMAIAGALERSGGGGVNAHFVLKGGVALEMRLQGKARATRDIDYSYRGPPTDDLVSDIEVALSQSYGYFTFQRTGKPLEMSRIKSMRLDIKVRFNGSEWGTVSIDVNSGEGVPTDIELIDAFDIDRAFGIMGPDKLPCLSLPDHIAQKLHGMTLPAIDANNPNERVQDAVDVLLFYKLFQDAEPRERLRESCEQIFRSRDTHSWPPLFDPPPHWREQFAVMATELEIPITDIETARHELREFITFVARRN